MAGRWSCVGFFSEQPAADLPCIERHEVAADSGGDQPGDAADAHLAFSAVAMVGAAHPRSGRLDRGDPVFVHLGAKNASSSLGVRSGSAEGGQLRVGLPPLIDVDPR